MRYLFNGLSLFSLIFLQLITSTQPRSSASIQVSPGSGPPGTKVTVSANGFTPGAPGEVHWDSPSSSPLAKGTIDANGNVKLAFHVPGNAAPGGHLVLFCEFCSQQGQSASWQFTVTPAQPTNTQPPTQVVQPPTATSTRTPTPSPSATSTASSIGTFTALPSLTATSPSETPPFFLLAPTPTLVPKTRAPFFNLPPFSFAPTATATPVTLDIAIVKYEVTQSVQCLNNPSCPDNSIPLYLDKPTLLRVYTRIVTGPWAISGISGLLCNQLYSEPPAKCIRPVQPITVYQTPDPVKYFRSNLAATLDFIIPQDWISTAGGHQFSIYVNPKYETALETADWNNKTYPYLILQPAKTMDVVFTRIKNDGYLPDINERWKIVDWLTRVLPAGDIRVWELPVRLAGDVETLNLNDTSGGGCGPWSTLLDDLEWLKGDNWQKYYLMVDYRASTTGYSGCGRYDGANVAAGLVGTGDRTGPEIAAQELGHTMNRHHAPSGGAGNPDPAYPVPGGLTDEYGVDVNLMQLYLPSKTYDFMGYAGGEGSKWISTYTYLGMAGVLPSSSFVPQAELASLSAPASPPQEYFVGSGSITPTQATIQAGFYHLALSTNTSDGLPAGPYTVRVLDSRNMVLFSRTFRPREDSNVVLTESGKFRLILPWSPEARSIVFLYHGQQIGRRTATPHAPVVQLISPSGNAHWGASGSQTIQWTGSDADGDPLTYLVEYSMDNGQTWTTMAANLTDGNLAIDSAEIPGSNAAKIRVIATDGFNTTSVDSAGVFAVDAKPPDLYIASPLEGAAIQKGAPLILRAFGTDLQDGPLGGGSFHWTSSLDGKLGTGNLLINTTLSAGNHVLTLAGTNSRGLMSSVSVKVEVTAPEVQSPPYFPVFVIVLLLVLAVVGTGLILLLRQRSR